MIPPRGENSTMLRPIATVTLIIATTVVFIWEVNLGPLAGQAVLTLGNLSASLFRRVTP
jgi:hypothetical protein